MRLDTLEGSGPLAPCRTGLAVAAVAIAALLSAVAHADSRTQAKRLHDRLTGIPPSEAVLASMASDIAAGRPVNAAYTAMQNPAFYNVTLKNFATPWTNRDQSPFAPLNDYTATVIGVVRDDLSFDRILYDDILYTGQNVTGVPPYSPANNDHYAALEAQGVSLKDALVQTTQSAANGLPPNATAGVLTTRAAAQAFFIAGTNRAMFRFTMLNHLCRDMDKVSDTTRPPDRIRQDVSRSPGGDSRVFLNNCIGCHSGMDPMVQAFAYYDYDDSSGRLLYTPGIVRPKYFRNKDTFPSGYSTPDDSWSNYWRQGRNALLGWDGSLPGSGQGAKSLGQEIARTDAFATCQVEKVFRKVCFRAPSDAPDRAQVQTMVGSFKSNGYQLKRVFAEAATYCMGD